MIIAAAAFDNRAICSNSCEAFNILRTAPPATNPASCDVHRMS
jgi:hypothetical protein